jgi:curved DNA-binding protein CbpA
MEEQEEQKVSSQIDQLKVFLEEKQELVNDESNYFSLLGLPNDATTDVIQRSYFQAVKQIHPDRLENIGASEYLEQAGQLFQKLTEAYETLSDVKKRVVYLKAMQEGKIGKETMNPEDEARIYAHRGSLMMKRRQYGEAEKFFEMALERIPTENEYKLDLAWAVFQNKEREDRERLQKSKEVLEEVLMTTGMNSRALFYMALHYKAKQDWVRQRRYLLQALNGDPNYRDAQREMRLLEMRLQKQRTSGFMGRLRSLFDRGKGKKKKKKRAGARKRRR